MKFVVLAFVMVVSACASTSERSGGSQPETTVRVENRSWMDMTIYVVQGSRRLRLGTVTAVSTRVFKIPEQMVFGIARLQFIADPIGAAASPISQSISVLPGGEVLLTIPNR